MTHLIHVRSEPKEVWSIGLIESIKVRLESLNYFEKTLIIDENIYIIPDQQNLRSYRWPQHSLKSYRWARKSRQTGFRDKTAYVRALDYR